MSSAPPAPPNRSTPLTCEDAKVERITRSTLDQHRSDLHCSTATRGAHYMGAVVEQPPVGVGTAHPVGRATRSPDCPGCGWPLHSVGHKVNCEEPA